MRNSNPSSLEPSRIAEALSALGIHWTQELSGFLVAPFRLGEEHKLDVTYDVEGDVDILVIRAASWATYDPDEFPVVIGSLNAWHNEYRWPVASLDVTEPAPRVIASFQVYLGAGVTDAQLAGLVAIGTDTLLRFHRYLTDQRRSARVRAEDLVSRDELEEWFRRAA